MLKCKKYGNATNEVFVLSGTKNPTLKHLIQRKIPMVGSSKIIDGKEMVVQKMDISPLAGKCSWSVRLLYAEKLS